MITKEKLLNLAAPTFFTGKRSVGMIGRSTSTSRY